MSCPPCGIDRAAPLQIIVNALEGSSEGISEGLLFLWVFSDVLDVVGCTISDTLPTMVMTAWMYFIFTVALLLQHLYYTRLQRAPHKDDDLEAPLLGASSEDDLVAMLYGPSIFEAPGGAMPRSSSRLIYGSLRNLNVRRSSSGANLSLTGASRAIADSFVHARRRTERSAPRSAGGRTPSSTAARTPTEYSSSLPTGRGVSVGSAAAAARLMAGLTLAGGALAAGGLITAHAAAGRGSLLFSSGGGAGAAAAPEGEFLGICASRCGVALCYAPLCSTICMHGRPSCSSCLLPH